MHWLPPPSSRQYERKLLSLVVSSAALFSVPTFGGQNIVVDQEHPFTGSGNGNYTFVSGEDRSDNVITITSYESLAVQNRLYGVRPNEGDALNNRMVINSQTQWFEGSAIVGTYVTKGSAVNNRVVLNSGIYSFTYDNGITGAKVSQGKSANGNVVEINEQTIIAGGSVRGAEVNNLTGIVSKNGILINGGYFSETEPLTANASIYGAFIDRSTASVVENFVEINGGTLDTKEIAAVNIHSGSPTEIKNNVVFINGGTFTSGSIYGVKGVGSKSTSGNGVIINGGQFEGTVNIYASDGAYSTNHDDFIEVNANDQMNLSNVRLYGSIYSPDNTLRINNANNLRIRSINRFDKLELGAIVWQTESPAVSIATDAQFKSISINSQNGFILEENQKISVGDSMTLVRSEVGYGFFSDLELTEEASDTVYTQANVARKISGNIIVTNEGNDIDYVVKNVELAEQTILLGENRAVTVAFLNEGSDAALKALEVPDELRGFALFAVAEGAASEYNVNDTLKINGWHFAAGLHGTADIADSGRLRAALYFENGTGNYRTFNSFNEEFFRGDGEVSYTGAGLAARYMWNNGWYAEGAIRVGSLKTEMSQAVRNARGNLLGYDSESFYWGGHLGLGRVLENESMKLDLYTRLYLTEVNGDSFNLGGDAFEFGDVSSKRFRIGSRIESIGWGLYFGAAYEREFDGEASMTAAGLNAPAESLKGNSFMGELGWKHRMTTIPFSVDLKAMGWTGERAGISGQMYLTYEF